MKVFNSNPVAAAPIPHERRSYGIKSSRETFTQIPICDSVIPSIPSLTHTLHFSTYGISEAERVYSSSTGSFLFVRRQQEQSVMPNEPSSVTRSFVIEIVVEVN